MARSMIYRGKRERDEIGGMTVFKDGEVLSPIPSQKLYNHSPDGFNWGYGGSGPAQLALALLYDVTGDAQLSLGLYQQFKWDWVAYWGDTWEITSDKIWAWVKGDEAGRLIRERQLQIPGGERE